MHETLALCHDGQWGNFELQHKSVWNFWIPIEWSLISGEQWSAVQWSRVLEQWIQWTLHLHWPHPWLLWPSSSLHCWSGARIPQHRVSRLQWPGDEWQQCLVVRFQQLPGWEISVEEQSEEQQLQWQWSGSGARSPLHSRHLHPAGDQLHPGPDVPWSLLLRLRSLQTRSVQTWTDERN